MRRIGVKLTQVNPGDLQHGTFRVPGGIEIIGNRAFYNINMIKLILPDSLKKIEQPAFFEYSLLTTIQIDTEDSIVFNQILNILDDRLHQIIIENIYGFYEEVAKIEQDSMTSYRFFDQFKKLPNDIIYQEILPRIAVKYGLPLFFVGLACENFEPKPELPLTDNHGNSFKC